MISAYHTQLLRYYNSYLCNLVAGKPFEPFLLREEKVKPDTTPALHAAINLFQQYEKRANGYGWVIEWKEWNSKKLGRQKWPHRILVETEDDYIRLLNKTEEVADFKAQLQVLLNWQPAIRSVLLKRPAYVLDFKKDWAAIQQVTDILLQKDVSNFYIRSIPVPVHTKFIEDSANKQLITSILKVVAPNRFSETAQTLEQTLRLKRKPYLYPLRWLDMGLSRQYMYGMELTAVTAGWLRQCTWEIKEIWLVENETNLHILPGRKDAIAIFSKGKATYSLSDIALFDRARLYYWGDLDEEGFAMLNAMRDHYPHIISVFMDEKTLLQHVAEMGKQPSLYKINQLSLLNAEEQAAFNILKYHNGRLEQEKIRQDHMADFFKKLSMQ